MYMPITYQHAVDNYPEQVKEVMAKLRKGKSKEKNAEPNQLKWQYDWWVSCGRAMSFSEVVEGIGKPLPPEPTIDEKVNEYSRNCMVGLSATIGRWYGRSTRLSNTPPEIIQQQRECLSKMAEDKRRFDALPKHKQEQEINGLINELGPSMSFAILGCNYRK